MPAPCRTPLAPLLSLATGLLLTSGAAAQAIYVDTGSVNGFGIPSDNYGAAIGLAGRWNAFDFGSNPTFPHTESALEDIFGNVTGVSATYESPGAGASNFQNNNAGTTGDDQALYDDLICPGGIGRLVFDGLAAGGYQVYTYAWAPDDATYLTFVSVFNSPDPTQIIGGPWPGDHQLGVTYALHEVTLNPGDPLIVEIDVANMFASMNGVQLFATGGPVGNNYCGPANLNSTGLPGIISAFGLDAVVFNDLTLTAENLPQNQFGMFLTSMTTGFIANPGGSQGNLCLGGAIGRYNRPGEIKNSGAGGTYSLVLDLTDTPQPTGSVSIMAGETWHWTNWFRDNNPGPTSNFTDGVSVLFQ